MSVRAGVDTGGTFTDLVLLDEASGEIRVTKVLSTLAEPSRSVFDSFEKAGVMTSDISDLVHGTTVATNARIERRGAGVALLTTDGFRDILRMQRTTRPSHFDLHWIKPRARAREAAASGPQPAVVDGAARRGVVLAD
jgi:N-methylhydantoinase A